MTNCTLCKTAPSVYKDYATGISINLCYNCLGIIGWNFEQQKIINLVSTCSLCHNKFLPKKNGQQKCSSCWSRFFQSIEPKENLPVKEEGGQRCL